MPAGVCRWDGCPEPVQPPKLSGARWLAAVASRRDSRLSARSGTRGGASRVAGREGKRQVLVRRRRTQAGGVATAGDGGERASHGRKRGPERPGWRWHMLNGAASGRASESRNAPSRRRMDSRKTVVSGSCGWESEPMMTQAGERQKLVRLASGRKQHTAENPSRSAMDAESGGERVRQGNKRGHGHQGRRGSAAGRGGKRRRECTREVPAGRR